MTTDKTTPLTVSYLDTNHITKNPFFLITASNGAFFLHSLTTTQTKFEGWHIPIEHEQGWDMLKVVENVKLSEPYTHVDMAKQTLHTKHATCNYYVNDQALTFHTHNYTGEVHITLDTRHIYDFEPFTKQYSIYDKLSDRHFIIEYTKTSPTSSYTYYIAIKSSHPLIVHDDWQQQHYPLDAQRKAHPTDLHVNNIIKAHVDKKFTLSIGIDTTPTKAINQLRSSAQFQHTILRTDSDIELAYYYATKNLQQLLVTPLQKQQGIFAGYPWFFQYWTRDEAISVHALILQKRLHTAKHILLRQLDKTLLDGRLSNRYPHSDLGSADGIGWTATRILDLMHLSPIIFTQEEKKQMYHTLVKQKELLEKNYMHDDLIYNEPLETWVDTGKDQDQRDGYCIEIQLLHQKINDLLYTLAPTIGQQYEKVNRLPKIKQHFFDGNILADRLTAEKKIDNTLRINGWIAYYLYPELLSHHEWETYFDTLIEALWLDWGGLASIDKNSPLFCPQSLGQTNESYHRGDSWYFLNNMATWCLLHLNTEKYKHNIEALLNASAKEILYMGALGHHAEISSAQTQKSEGCLSQAWSAAMYIEAYQLYSARLKN